MNIRLCEYVYLTQQWWRFRGQKVKCQGQEIERMNASLKLQECRHIVSANRGYICSCIFICCDCLLLCACRQLPWEILMCICGGRPVWKRGCCVYRVHFVSLVQILWFGSFCAEQGDFDCRRHDGRRLFCCLVCDVIIVVSFMKTIRWFVLMTL